MRSVSPAYSAALIGAPEHGLVVTALISVLTVNLESGEEERFGYSTDIETYDWPVRSAETGALETRTYVGGGTILDVEPVKLTTGLSVKQWSCTLSVLHDEVELMVRGRQTRGRPVEMHFALSDPETRALHATPLPDFYGLVNTIDLDGGRAGQEGGVELSCVGQTIDLTRANFATRSDATIRQRYGDALGQYMGTMGHVSVPWGQKAENGNRWTRRAASRNARRQ